MKFPIKELDNEESKIAYIFLHALSVDDADAIYKAIPNPDENSELDVKITVNGIDIDVEKATTRIYDCIAWCAKCMAKEMFQNNFDDKIYDCINELNILSEKVGILNKEINWDNIYDDTFIKK